MDTMAHPRRHAQAQRVTLELALSQLRTHNFAVLSTVGDDGRPYSAGVNYGVSRPGSDLAIYVMTRRHLQKARNIARNRGILMSRWWRPSPDGCYGFFRRRPSNCMVERRSWTGRTRREPGYSGGSGEVGGSSRPTGKRTVVVNAGSAS